MRNAELAGLNYLKLAVLSAEKQQSAGCARFLVLAGVAACRSGWLEIAEACRSRLLERNPQHLLGRWESFPDALRSEDFPIFLQQLERFCSVERAETLLSRIGEAIDLDDEPDAKAYADEILNRTVWRE